MFNYFSRMYIKCQLFLAFLQIGVASNHSKNPGASRRKQARIILEWSLLLTARKPLILLDLLKSNNYTRTIRKATTFVVAFFFVPRQLPFSLCGPGQGIPVEVIPVGLGGGIAFIRPEETKVRHDIRPFVCVGFYICGVGHTGTAHLIQGQVR